MEHKSDFAMYLHLSLYISDSQKTFGMQGTPFKSNESWQHSDNLWMPKHFGHFGQHLWLVLDFGLDMNWEMSITYAATLCWSILSPLRRYHATIRPVWGIHYQQQEYRCDLNMICLNTKIIITLYPNLSPSDFFQSFFSFFHKGRRRKNLSTGARKWGIWGSHCEVWDGRHHRAYARILRNLGRQRGYLASLGVPGSPRHPPVVTSLFFFFQKNV